MAELRARIDPGPSELHNEAVLLAARLARLRGEVRRGTLTHEQAQQQRLLLVQATLEFLGELAKKTPSAPAGAAALADRDQDRDRSSPSMPRGRPLRILLHHAPSDAEYAGELRKHLQPLCRQGLAELFAPLLPGAVLEQEQERWLREADLLLALLSVDYLAAADCEALLRRALERPGGGLRIVPVLLRATRLEGTLLAGRQALPTNSRPVTEWRHRDAAWQAIATALSSLLRGAPALG